MEVDSSRLRRLAATVRDEAERVRGGARRLAGVGAVRWHSPAGRLFRDRVEERVHALRATAARLDHAADLVEAHARAVDRVVAELATAAGAAADVADHVRRTVQRGLDG
ncbi:hypothetical protein GCM10027517_38120 [Phycicoccus ginsengisoli]